MLISLIYSLHSLSTQTLVASTPNPLSTLTSHPLPPHSRNLSSPSPYLDVILFLSPSLDLISTSVSLNCWISYTFNVNFLQGCHKQTERCKYEFTSPLQLSPVQHLTLDVCQTKKKPKRVIAESEPALFGSHADPSNLTYKRPILT